MAPDFGVPQNFGSKDISSIFVSIYICIFVLVPRTCFYYAAKKYLYRTGIFFIRGPHKLLHKQCEGWTSYVM